MPASPRCLCDRKLRRSMIVLLRRLGTGFFHQLLRQSLLAGMIELLDLVIEHALVHRLVPVVEGREPEQGSLADELAQHLVGWAHDPARLAVSQVALDAE